MPFKSEAQRRWMYENKPEIAKKWEQERRWDRVEQSLPERIVPKGFWDTKDWWKRYK
jgi:hypothetical protein